MDNDASGGSRQATLGNVLAESSSRSCIGEGSGDKIFSSYGDDAFYEGVDDNDASEERSHAGGKYCDMVVDLRERGTGSGSREEETNQLSRDRKTATSPDHLERNCAVDVSDESLEKRGVHCTVNRIDRAGPGHVDTSGNNSNHDNHASDSDNETAAPVSGNHHRETQRPMSAVPTKPGGKEGKMSAARLSSPSARWPSPRSVELSRGYIYYACKAGDYADGRCPGEGCAEGGGERRRGLSRWRRKPRRKKRQNRRASSPQNAGSETVVGKAFRGETSGADEDHLGEASIGCDEEGLGNADGPGAAGRKLHDMGHGTKRENNVRRKQDNTRISLSKEKLCASNVTQPRRGDSTAKSRGPNGKENCSWSSHRRRGGGGGHDLSGGLPTLESDMRGAMVAVWLAWGVRIDAAREKLRQEKRWLKAAHRAEIAKVTTKLSDTRRECPVVHRLRFFLALENGLSR